MANQEHLNILKQGVQVWNQWRLQHPETLPDLSEADFSKVHLSEINFTGATLSRVDFSEATLNGASIDYAILSRTNFTGANLSEADFTGSILSQATLAGAILTGAFFGWTTFGNVDLDMAKGLETTIHHGPSSIGIEIINRLWKGIPEVFLRGAGISDDFIKYVQTQTSQPTNYFSCFISYSSRDEALARRLHADLQTSGVRCWFAPEDMKIGDRFHSRIDEAIHLQDKLLLLLSESAIQSNWVEIEVRAALEEEQRQHRDVLFPIRLDNNVMQTSQAWAAMLRRSRHIGDFTNWANPQAYQIAFDRLMRDLKKADEPQAQELKP